MSYLPRHSKSRPLTLIVACVIALLASSVSMGLGTGAFVAHAAPQNACSQYYMNNYYSGFWDAAYQVIGVTSCLGDPPRSMGYLYPCSDVNVYSNMDTWLSQVDYAGGTRLAESGRTGILGWASDCQWHEQVQVIGWGQVTTEPLWGCLWVYDQTVNLSFDWLCAQNY